MREAEDFRAEARALAAVTAGLPDAAFGRATLFKGWTIGDVLGHLMMFDLAALLSATDEAGYDAFVAPIVAGMGRGRTLLDIQNDWLRERKDGLSGAALREEWRAGAERVADVFSGLDPKRRLRWLGPDMSARSSITARQMETWAHGQEVFDLLGEERRETDRVRNICHLGVATYGWTFANRGETAPEPAPYVRLTAPSGAIWEWGAPQEGNCVTGEAVGFAQVVAQTRNIADVDVRAVGAAATRWMAVAQCFAGPVNDPPAPGARFRMTGRR
ncbi:TIGR03084 family protein [Pikeienuella piscinae]|uniref:TIGR03084 family protein n=1 Tax=Pikeienuella piscinae TaxID=2748098 RepID=A0A7L5BXG7_9RHOB|nr:TIGR03084 family metal-binding protein [Pikeienuella piscinae]QIE55217.1 TIGR03084 family protein [Pikeienuella piscinae]